MFSRRDYDDDEDERLDASRPSRYGSRDYRRDEEERDLRRRSEGRGYSFSQGRERSADKGERGYLKSWGETLFGHRDEEDVAHHLCGMIAPKLKSSRGRITTKELCRSVPGEERTTCKFFVNAFGEDILERLRDREPIDQICDELDYAKTSPVRQTDQSDWRKRENIRGGEEARGRRGGDPTRDSVPFVEEEGERALTMTRARKPGGASSAGLNKGGRAMPIVSSGVQKEVGWETVDPYEEGHPAASSGRAGAKGVGLNTRGHMGY